MQVMVIETGLIKVPALICGNFSYSATASWYMDGACTFFPCSYTLNPNDLGYNDHHKNN